ncbi:endonuclease/exonuclease/phosphatase family protein [Cellulomonas rhizosphaerae]|uniref:Fibronectin type-III domain-containing protein n=1 Tax=Cellulomonas rhizosphaerae TaxID=2293719 RepID=A0A413RI12_9CELL|nr:endonuclease/exonuclease/phosphatase family protein [Cellulomonas rhizosphaerae]RHA37899.1 hypothetical protein D1825_15870 [Cellulomonas rhizosphaerae]
MPHQPPARSRVGRLGRRLVATVVALGVMGTVAVASSSAGPALATPATIGAGAVSHHTFDLAWAAVPRATGYRVEVAADPGFAHVVWRWGPTRETSMSVHGPGIDEDSTYYARVSAVADQNVSLPTSVVSVHTPWQAPGKPGEPRATKVSTSGFTVQWSPAARAEQYVAFVATDPDFTENVQEKTVTDTSLSVKVRDGRRYYVKVTPLRKGLTAATVDTTLKTPLKKLGKPGRVFAEPMSSSSLRVAWPAATNATGYTVQLLRKPGAKPSWTTTTTKPSAMIEGLKPSKAQLRPVFYVKVVANRYGLRHTSSKTVASTLLPGSTKRATSFTAQVSSYNLLKPSETDAGHRSWEKRYAAAAKQLRGLDLVGLQETPWNKTDGKRPVLRVAAKAHLALARHAGSKKPCTTASQPILYKRSRFTVVDCGRKQLADKGPKKWVTWALVRETKTGRKVFVANAHLLAHLDTASSTSQKVQRIRVQQTQRLAREIAARNTTDSPVILVGDLNTYPNRAAVTPIDVLARNGLVSAELVAAKRVGAEFASFHGFAAGRRSGHHFDHVIVDRQSEVLTYRVRHMDTRRAPSDHFQIVATVAVH